MIIVRAGGGGCKSRDRRTRLRAKNERLNEQRRRRADEEAKQAQSNEGKYRKKSKTGQSEKPVDDERLQANMVDNGDIHPSRRNRMAGFSGTPKS